jgi:hypothetical protein
MLAQPASLTSSSVENYPCRSPGQRRQSSQLAIRRARPPSSSHCSSSRHRFAYRCALGPALAENPQFNADALPISLAAVDIAYRHLRALGGLRHLRKDAPPSPNTLWRNLAFRNYADYAATDAFRLGLDQLRALAREHHCAIMCAEAVWWRCHRRIITDYLWLKESR